MKLRDRIKSKLRWEHRPPVERQRILRRTLPVLHGLARVGGMLRFDIRVLALLCMTDKFGDHDYISAYATHFRRFRNRNLNLLEIGVGGYAHDIGGRSLMLWSTYFRRGRIVGLDIEDKTRLSRGRIKVYQGSQIDPDGLKQLVDSEGGAFDIIIDDGSHENAHQIESFRFLFRHVKPGGIYVIEDLQTSYWLKYGGGVPGSDDHRKSAMYFLSGIIDSVNYPFFANENQPIPADVRDDIAAIHIYPEICFIEKRT
jgi:demethylmacrocin O-methyltransferase